MKTVVYWNDLSETLTTFLLVSGYDTVGNYVEDGKYEEANLKWQIFRQYVKDAE